MITQLLPPDPHVYSLADDILKSGGLVAFPTETVYGLGANALDREAVLSIFAAKGRPADNPLIVHIHDRSQLEPLCDVPERSALLMDAFWPGPLTILCRKKTRMHTSLPRFRESGSGKLNEQFILKAQKRGRKLL